MSLVFPYFLHLVAVGTCLKSSSSYGSGYGVGTGKGAGYGVGAGYGAGAGFGSGAGYGTRIGYGSGVGYGTGAGYGQSIGKNVGGKYGSGISKNSGIGSSTNKLQQKSLPFYSPPSPYGPYGSELGYGYGQGYGIGYGGGGYPYYGSYAPSPYPLLGGGILPLVNSGIRGVGNAVGYGANLLNAGLGFLYGAGVGLSNAIGSGLGLFPVPSYRKPYGSPLGYGYGAGYGGGGYGSPYGPYRGYGVGYGAGTGSYFSPNPALPPPPVPSYSKVPPPPSYSGGAGYGYGAGAGYGASLAGAPPVYGKAPDYTKFLGLRGPGSRYSVVKPKAPVIAMASYEGPTFGNKIRDKYDAIDKDTFGKLSGETQFDVTGKGKIKGVSGYEDISDYFGVGTKEATIGKKQGSGVSG